MRHRRDRDHVQSFSKIMQLRVKSLICSSKLPEKFNLAKKVPEGNFSQTLM